MVERKDIIMLCPYPHIVLQADFSGMDANYICMDRNLAAQSPAAPWCVILLRLNNSGLAGRVSELCC
jgi:hypothetical protein